jgi:hypothetical protein
VSNNSQSRRAVVDALFTDNRSHPDSPIGLRDLPYLARPIVEYLHGLRPDVIIAADRGARLLAITALRSWHKRFPGERFPTLDTRIHFARVTSRSADESQVERAIHHALGNAGLHARRGEASPKIVLLDDWADGGETAKRFIRAVESFGLPSDSISFVTMCNTRVEGINHVVSDPHRMTNNSIWNEVDEYIGVSYGEHAPTAPIVSRNNDALGARIRLSQYIDAYYERFSAAVALGEVATCSCREILSRAS